MLSSHHSLGEKTRKFFIKRKKKIVAKKTKKKFLMKNNWPRKCFKVPTELGSDQRSTYLPRKCLAQCLQPKKFLTYLVMTSMTSSGLNSGDDLDVSWRVKNTRGIIKCFVYMSE